MRVIMTQHGMFRYSCGMTRTIAAIYARISQDKYKGEDQEGLNVEEQIEACKTFIASKDWSVGTVYRDDSISATSGAIRPDFEKMLREVPPVVVYWKQSRLERGNANDLERFLMLGCEGYGIDGTRATMENASGELITKMMSSFYKFEQRVKAENQKQANLRIAKAGRYRGSIRPFGQERTGEWVTAEAEEVRKAAKLIAAGKQSFFKTAELWNAAGLLTPATGKQGGKQWTSGTVRNFFTRPRLIGFQDYQGTLYLLKDWTPLLEKETFEQIQTLIESKRTGKPGVSTTRSDMHLLTNIARCIHDDEDTGKCGRGMNSGQRGGAGSPRTYRCPTVKHQTVTAPPLEDAVSLHALDLLMQHEDARKEVEEASRALAALMSEKRTIEAAQVQWLKEAGEAGTPIVAITGRENAHAKQISAMNDEILKLNQDMKVSIFQLPDGPVELGKTTDRNLHGWRSVSMEQRRDLLKTLFEKITIQRAGQGKRFDAALINYTYTPLGRKLADRWADAETEFQTISAGTSEIRSIRPWEHPGEYYQGDDGAWRPVGDENEGIFPSRT